MVQRKCGHCINGFVMTGYGRKPCMYCKGTGYIYIEENDNSGDSSNRQSYKSGSDRDFESSCLGQIVTFFKWLFIVFGSIFLVSYLFKIIGGG